MKIDIRSTVPVLRDDGKECRTCPWWAVVPALVVLLWIGSLYYNQAIRGVPVPTKPLSGDTVPDLNLYLSWNPLVSSKTVIRVQLFEDAGSGKKAVLDKRTSGTDRLKIRRFLKPGTKYYWRMRCIEDGIPGGWTRMISFRTR